MIRISVPEISCPIGHRNQMVNSEIAQKLWKCKLLIINSFGSIRHSFNNFTLNHFQNHDAKISLLTPLSQTPSKGWSIAPGCACPALTVPKSARDNVTFKMHHKSACKNNVSWNSDAFQPQKITVKMFQTADKIFCCLSSNSQLTAWTTTPSPLLQ